MSYSALILKDSPEAVWSMDEVSGSVAYADAFINSETYNGQYYSGKYSRSFIPITYGGKTCISSKGTYVSNYSTNNKIFSIPSLGKFSSQTRGSAHTLEFWMNLSINAAQLSSGAASRTGESKIVSFSGATNTGLYIRDLDYLVFKIGDNSSNRIYESCVHVPNFNTPLHIMVIYTTYSIQLIVNGVSGNVPIIEDNVFGAEETRTIDFLFPNRINSSSEYFDGVSYDTVAIYPNALDSSIAKRHYVYGLGYDVPKYIYKSLGGVNYETNMQQTQPLKQINYLNNDSWSTRAVLKNLVANNNNLSTANYNNHSVHLSSENLSYSQKDMFALLSGESFIKFPSDCYSYVEVNNHESITNGNTKKIEAIFKIDSSHATTGDQQLMYIGSRSASDKYISCLINNKDVIIKYKTQDGTETTLLTHTIYTTSTSFLISLAKNGGEIVVRVIDDNNVKTSGTITSSNIFPMQDSFIRFGSSPVFQGSVVPKGITTSQIKRFDGYLSQVDLIDSSAITVSWSARQTKGISDLYQLYPKYYSRSIAVATSGSFAMTLSLTDLIGLDKHDATFASGIFMAPKCEIGSNSADITYNLKTIVGSTTSTIESGSNIRLINIPTSIASTVKAQEVQYEITGTVRSSDIYTTPGILDYFRIYTYPVLQEESRNYIEVNDTNPGKNVMYFSGYSSSTNHPFQFLPELEKTTDLHRSFYTGIRVGSHNSKNPYIKIPFDVKGITSDATTEIYSVMFSGKGVGDPALIEFFRTTGIQVTSADPEDTGIEVYINGQRYSNLVTYDFSTWNYYSIVFTNGIPYNSNLFFGFDGSGWMIDNITVLTSIPADQEYLYNILFSTNSIRVPDGSAGSFRNILISDSEASDGRSIYQPLTGQTSFLSFSSCPRLASTVDVPITSVSTKWHLIYNTNRDLLRIDNSEIIPGDIILLKNQATTTQNGIYTVDSIDTAKAILTKSSAPANGSVIFIRGGKENKSYYYLKNGNSYTKTQTQKKAVGFNKSSPSITSTVVTSA
jgi:hypothetical protein